MFVVRVTVPDDLDKTEVHQQFNQDYQQQLAVLEARYEVKQEQLSDLKQQNTDLHRTIQTLANRSININNTAETHHMSDTFNLSGNIQGSNINIKSRLDHVTQHIQQLPQTTDEDKQQLQDLIQQLQQHLEQIPENQQAYAKAVAAKTDALIQEAADNPPADLLKISAEGLISAATALVATSPMVIEVVKQIVLLLVP